MPAAGTKCRSGARKERHPRAWSSLILLLLVLACVWWEWVVACESVEAAA